MDASTDYYLGHSAVSADANGALVMLYDGATTAGGPQTVFSRRSTDAGASWSARTALSTAGVFSSFPAMESRGSGDVRVFYMQQDGGPDAWNVWYRGSTDGGRLVVRAGQDLRRDRRHHVQVGRWLPRAVRRLR